MKTDSNIYINAAELGMLTTLITDFIFERSDSLKTFNELTDIFNRDYQALTREIDGTNRDLRILDFERLMREGEWRGSVILLQDASTKIINDGIHRGVAYLRCVQQGVGLEQLPPIILQPYGF